MNRKEVLSFIIYTCNCLFSFGQNISLKHFDVRLGEAHIFLAWEIGDSLINEPFQIQRSTDGKLFETITTIPISGEAYYEYVDSAAKGYYTAIYYRLCQKQNDLFALYSPIVSLQKINVSATYPIVFPNPVENVLSLDYSPSNGDWMFIRIADQAGRIIYQSPKMKHVHLPKWNVSTFPTGIYNLIVVSQTEIHSVPWLKK